MPYYKATKDGLDFRNTAMSCVDGVGPNQNACANGEEHLLLD